MATRPRVELTHRGWALCGAGLGLVVASRLLGAVELAVLGLSALVLLVGAHVWVRTRTGRVRVRRTVRPSRTQVGADARVDLEVVGPGPGTTPQTTLTDDFDGGRRAARFLVPPLASGQHARAAYRVPTTRRGRFTIGPAVLGVADPFGLARAEWHDAADLEITVCPRVHDLRAPAAAPGLHRSPSPLTATFQAASPTGDEFLALREYAPGDDLRRIHWRATARTGDLVVREDETQWQPSTTVLLDTRAETHTDESFEAAVEAVASIVARLVRSGQPFEVATTSGHVLGDAAAGRRHGVGIEARIMDELAVLQPTRAAGGRPGAALTRGPRRRGLLVAVVGDAPPAEADALLGTARAATPVVLVHTRAAPPRPSTRAAMVVDGRPGAFVGSWNAVMLGAGRARRRVGRA
jgi:uncharacterized protein (DUF58 family)